MQIQLIFTTHPADVTCSHIQSSLKLLARAFSAKPAILFADEPTGNLDQETGEKVIKLLFELNQEAGTTLVIVTHDMDLAQKTQRILRLKGGKVFSTTETEVV